MATTAKQTASAMQGYLPVMQKFETKFSCSAMCKPGLFWFTRDASLGAPPADAGCIGNILKETSSGYTVPGFTVMICAVLMLFIFCFQYTLWCDKEDDQWGN